MKEHQFDSKNKYGISKCTNCGLIRNEHIPDKWDSNSVEYRYNVEGKWVLHPPQECIHTKKKKGKP